MKNSNLSSKIALLFFKVFSFMIYILLHALYEFVCINRLLYLFEILSNYEGSNEKKFFFFTAKCSCNILYMLVELMPKVASISHYFTWRSCIIIFCTALMFSNWTTDFGWPLRNSSVSEWRPRLNSLYQRTVVENSENMTKIRNFIFYFCNSKCSSR